MDPLISALGYWLNTFSCTARAPWSRHKGQVGESSAKNRTMLRSELKRFLRGSRVLSRTTIPSDGYSNIIICTDWNFKFSIKRPQGGFAPDSRQHLTNITEASLAFGIFDGTLAAAEFFFPLDLCHYGGSTIYPIIPQKIIIRVTKTVAY